MNGLLMNLYLFFQIWFFSDSDDPSVVKKTNGHLVNTKCSSSHNRSALCCKMAAEIMAFLATDNRWANSFNNVGKIVTSDAQIGNLTLWEVNNKCSSSHNRSALRKYGTIFCFQIWPSEQYANRNCKVYIANYQYFQSILRQNLWPYLLEITSQKSLLSLL